MTCYFPNNNPIDNSPANTMQPDDARLNNKLNDKTPFQLKRCVLNMSRTIGMTALAAVLPLYASTASASTADVADAASAYMPLDYMVAVVNQTPILKSDLDAATAVAKQALSAQGSAIPPEKTLQAQVLDQLITRTAQMSIIQRSGQSINNQAVNAALQEIAVKQGAQNLSQLQQILEAKQPGSYSRLREQVREELALGQLRNQELAKRIHITEQDVDNFLQSPESQRLFNTEYNTNHIRIFLPRANATDAQKVEAMNLAQQIKANLDTGMSVQQTLAQAQVQTKMTIQGGNMGFHGQNELPSYLRQDIMALKKGQTTSPIVNDDGVHIVQLADIKDDASLTEHQWLVRHLLIKPNEVQNITQAEHRIEDLYDQLRKGANFTTLASTYSDDPGSAKQGGSLGWVSKGQMVQKFEEMMFITQAGDFSAPFQTQFGWHILKVEDERDKNLSEAYRRKLARETLFSRMSAQVLEDWSQELRTQSYVKILDPEFAPES